MRNFRTFIIIIIIILIGIVANPFRILSPIKNYTFTIFSPITSGFYQSTLSTKSFFHSLFSIDHLLNENNQLKIQLIDLKSDNIKSKEIQHENDVLKEELKFVQSTKLQLISANIIAKSPSGYVDSVVINKGSKDGIKEDRAVVSQGFLIGRTKNVAKNTAEVVLITSNSSKIPGFLQDSRGTGLIQGGLKGLIIDDIQLDINPKKNEAVLSSDIGNILPRGIPIGHIKDINTSQTDISHSATIDSPISFSHLEMVFVTK